MAANTLRSNMDLPRDLRASAARTCASLLFQKASTNFKQLKVNFDAPWPKSTFDEVLTSTNQACDAYEEAVAESSDPDLCKEIEAHCPEWPDVIAATQKGHVAVRTLLAALRFQEVSWHCQQVGHARAVAEAERHGVDLDNKGSSGMQALKAVGLSPKILEEDLCMSAFVAAKKVSEECIIKHDTVDGDGNTTLLALRSRGQAFQMLILKDMAIACAMSKKIDKAVEHMLQALHTHVEDETYLPDMTVKQVQAAAEGLLELLKRELITAETQSQAKNVPSKINEIDVAVKLFNSNRKVC